MQLLRHGWIAGLVLVCGCASPFPKDVRLPQMSGPELTRYYAYPRVPIHARLSDPAAKDGWTHELVEFDLSLPPDLNNEDVVEARREVAATKDAVRASLLSLDYTVRFDYFRPTSAGKHPLIMMSPILGGNSLFVVDIAKFFASKGYCVALVHRKRTAIRNNEGLEQIEVNLRKSVLRVRQALDWALQQPEVDPSKVASFGISYGAIINTMVAGAEPRIRYHVFALGGGDLPSIIMSSAEPQIRRQVAKLVRINHWTHAKLREELEHTLKSDPLNSAPLLDRNNVLMVVAQYDSVVGTPYENLLWKKIGKPRRIVVPLGHYTTALALPYIRGQTLQFLDKKFGIPRREVPGTNFQSLSSKRY